MGASIGWLAVKGKDSDAVLGALDLVRNEQTESHPRRGFAITLPSGWFVVVTRFASPLIAEESLRPLSRGCTVVTCEQDDQQLVSAATCYVDGLRTWRVEHDGQQEQQLHDDQVGHRVMNRAVEKDDAVLEQQVANRELPRPLVTVRSDRVDRAVVQGQCIQHVNRLHNAGAAGRRPSADRQRRRVFSRELGTLSLVL